jgi:hypothetical protein
MREEAFQLFVETEGVVNFPNPSIRTDSHQLALMDYNIDMASKIDPHRFYRKPIKSIGFQY